MFLMLCRLSVVLFLFFFFQAEDGIRDTSVTGVQTCALPIFALVAVGRHQPQGEFTDGATSCGLVEFRQKSMQHAGEPARSEERRVGKECRSRWSPDQ